MFLEQDSIPQASGLPTSNTRLNDACIGHRTIGQGEDIESTPYNKSFGFENDEREYEYGDSPDGSALSVFRHAFG